MKKNALLACLAGLLLFPVLLPGQDLGLIRLQTERPASEGVVSLWGGAEEGGFRFLPHGMMFEGEAFVSLPYDSTLIPFGYSVKDIRTFFYDEKKEKWVALPLACVNSEERTIESRTTHFTDMINALLKTPDNPEGNIFVPTQMQGLNATNPISGITMMEAPHANARGSLMLQYPINVPVGRQ